MEFLPLEEVRRRESDVRACLEVLYSGDAREWNGVSPGQAAQLKFEVHEKLRAHYEREEQGNGLAFALVHAGRLGTYRIAEPRRHPRLAGYCLLVRDPKRDASLSRQEGALRGVPRARGGPQPRRASSRPTRRCRRRTSRASSTGSGRTVDTSPTCTSASGAGHEGLLAVREYWYLRWWNTRTREYIYSYRAELRHHYVVARRGHAWRVLTRRRHGSPRGS